MSFNYPQFLWALLALAIPIVIHLFNFRKTLKVYFSNTRFLRQIRQETTQKRKLKQYLILASRLLFILFLVLAFAQPFLPAKEQFGNQRNVVLYLDNSYSMFAPVSDNMRTLDAAVSFVQEIVQVFPTETRYQLLTNDFAPFSNSFKTRAEIIELLSQIRLSPVSRTQAEVRNRISEKNATVFWISDFQKATFGDPVAFDSTWQVRLVRTAQTQQSNVYVDSVYLQNPLVISGEKNALKVIFKNNGDQAVHALMTKLTINGIQAATTSVNIEPNSSTEANFDLTQSIKGFNPAVITFNDYPISFDNEFFFALNARGRLNIIEIKPSTAVTYVEKVFGNRELFNFRSFSTANVDYGAMESADLLILNGISSLDPALSAAVASYQTTSKNIILIPAAKPDLSSYQSIVNLPLKVATAAVPVTLDAPDFKNPFFQNVFEEKATSMAMPQATRLLDWGADRTAILSFKDGNPFLSQFANVYLFSCPLEKGLTDFYSHALFLPVMYRMAASAAKEDENIYYSLSTSLITVAADSLMGEEPVKLNGQQELIPSQTKTATGVVMELPRYSISPGFYPVTFRKDTLGLLAFNLDKRESILETFSAEELLQTLGANSRVTLFEASSTESFSNEIKARYLGTPLWKYCLVLALVFLLMEVLLIRFLK